MAIRIPLSFPPVQKPLSPIPKSAFFSLPIHRRRFSISASAVTATPLSATATMYELLSVPKTAGPDEIRAAYRHRARQWHPDVCPSSSDKSFFAEQFIRAREAYEVLSDPDLRQVYDLTLGAGVPHERWSRAGADRSGARSGGGFADWESQFEGLERRSDARAAAAATSTW